MKIQIIVSLILSFAWLSVQYSCTDIAEETVDENNKLEQERVETTDGIAVQKVRYKNAFANPVCSKYLKRYKKWLSSYVQVRIKYKDENTSQEAMIKFRQLVNEGKDIGDPPEECAGERDFQDSLSRIDEAASKALERTELN
jgi:hypothetical protein